MSTTCLKRLAREVQKLKQTTFDDTPVVAVEPIDGNMMHMIAFLMGPSSLNNPYHNGFFFVDVQFPNEYPFKSPSCKWLSSDDGKVRMNPNLYAQGKVCLSILGTWRGNANETWVQTAGVLTVMQAIQNVVMNEKPYHNEPGFEERPGASALEDGAPPTQRKRTTSNDDTSKRVQNYSDKILHETIRISVCDVLETLFGIKKKHSLQKYFSIFRNEIIRQFSCRFESYVQLCKQMSPIVDGRQFVVERFEGGGNQCAGTFDFQGLLGRLLVIRKAQWEVTNTWKQLTSKLTTSPSSEEEKQNLARIKQDFQEFQKSKHSALVQGGPKDASANAFEYEIVITPDAGDYKGKQLIFALQFCPSLNESPKVQLLSKQHQAYPVTHFNQDADSDQVYHPNVSPLGSIPLYFSKEADFAKEEDKQLLPYNVLLQLVAMFSGEANPNPPTWVNAEGADRYFSQHKSVAEGWKDAMRSRFYDAGEVVSDDDDVVEIEAPKTPRTARGQKKN